MASVASDASTLKMTLDAVQEASRATAQKVDDLEGQLESYVGHRDGGAERNRMLSDERDSDHQDYDLASLNIVRCEISIAYRNLHP